MAIIGEYSFHITPPEESYKVAIHYRNQNERLLTAVEQGSRIKLSDPGLMKILLIMPLVTFKVMAAIHWQAVKLLFRGARYHPNISKKEMAE
jgi:DUF1365 family protein